MHPSNHPLVIAGQGTAALEFVQDAGQLDVVMVLVGGGRLLAGTALVVAGHAPFLGTDQAPHRTFVSRTGRGAV